MPLGQAPARSGVEAAVGYRRLHVLLDRRGVAASSPRVYRKEGLAVRLHEQLAGGKSRPVLAALIRIGWREKRQSGSHVVFARPGSPACVFAFHDREELGPHMLAKIAKVAGLRPDDL